MQIVIKAITKQGTRGDRGWALHEYFDYEIHLVKDGVTELSNETLMANVFGYDWYNSSINDKNEMYYEARNAANHFRGVIGIDKPLIWINKPTEQRLNER